MRYYLFLTLNKWAFPNTEASLLGQLGTNEEDIIGAEQMRMAKFCNIQEVIILDRKQILKHEYDNFMKVPRNRLAEMFNDIKEYREEFMLEGGL